MPVPGQAAPPEMAPGAAEIAKLQAAKFSPEDIAKYQHDTTQTLLHAGYSVQQVDAHWGTQPPHSPEIAAHVANNMQRAGWGSTIWAGVTGAADAVMHPINTIQHAMAGNDPTAAFEAGYGTSVAGIAQHMATGQDPNKAFQVKPHPGLLNGIAESAGQITGDVATDVLGFFGGVVAGAAVPGLGETGISEVVGAVGGAAGMGIASQGTREVLLDAYNRGQIHGVSDFLHIVGASTIRTLKAGAANAPFGLIGPIGGALADAGAGKVTAAVAASGTATAAGVAIGAGLNGKMPDAKDFITAAATMLIAHGAGKAGSVVKGVFRPSDATLHVQSNLEQIYRRNGTTPWEAINQAKTDAGLRQEIMQQDVSGDSVAPRTHAIAPQEPPPIKPAGTETAASAETGLPKNTNFDEPTTSPSGRYTHEPTAESKKNTAIYSEYRATPTSEPVKLSLLVDHATGKTTVNINTAKIESAGDTANTHGPAEVRDILSEVLQAHPEITEITGVRKTGAGGKAEITQSLSRTQVARIRARLTGEPQQIAPRPAPVVKTFEDLSTALEGSRDDSVSPAGAIGKHQIMIGTARQYGYGQGMSQAELAQWLHDPNNNAQVFHSIASDLHQRFHGDMNAMLIAYNAGPGRAGQYMKAGPGTELEAIPDKSSRSGIRYESVPSARDESFLPAETQKYLANGRRRSGGAGQDAGGESEDGGGPPALRVFPHADNQAEPDEAASDRFGGGNGGEPPDGGLPGLGGPEGPNKRTFTPEAATEELMANIGEPPKPPSLLNPDRLMEQYVSELSPARNIDTALVREGGFDRNRDIGQEDMFRQTYASDTRTGAFVRFGVLRIEDGAIKVVEGSPSIMKAADEVRAAGGNMRGWTAWMLAKRTVDKERQGVKTGFNLDAANALATDHGSQGKYEAATQTFNRVMDGGLEYGRDSGLFSQDQVESMMRDNPAYISMRRIMGDNESFGTGKRGFAARDPLRQMEGSDRQIIDPIYATIDNLRVIIAMADRNRAIGSIIGQVESDKLKYLGLQKMDPKYTVSAGPDEPFKPYALGEDADQTYQPLLAERSAKGLSPNEFIYYRNGVAERWKATNPALVTLMRKSVGPGEVNIIGKAFDKIAALDRAGIVLEPSFPTRVTLRHQVTAFIADPLHPPPFITWMSGIHDALTEKGVFPEWMANGGAGTALADMDVKWLQRDMEFTFEDQGVFNRMWNRVKHPLEAAQWMSERIDAAARIGYYKLARSRGIEPLKAATMSRKAMLDYAEKASLEAVNSVARKVPFLRPKILGIKMFAENFADRPAATAGYGALGVLGMTVATVTVPTMLLYAANYFADKSLPEEEKYSSIPRWIRDTHYITPPIAGARVQFPYPFVVGTVFGGLVNRFLDHWVKTDPHAFDDWASGTLSDYKPQEMLPTAIKTPLESVANYNFMSGHAIVPSSVEAADGYMQYTNATTEPAKAVSRYLGAPGLNIANFSPMQLEHWVDGWTGPIGMGVLRAVNGRMTDYKPPSQMADMPIAGTFFVRNPQMHAQQIEDFYTDMKAMEAAHADWAMAMKHGDQGEIAAAARGPFYGLRVVGKIAAALHVQAAAVSAVNNDKTMRPEEKSQAVDQILNSMIQLSVMGSGVTATLQGKEPSQAFKDLDKSGAMAAATSQ